MQDLRKEKNLSQVQLAEKLDYTQSNVSGWENGTIEPKATALATIAKFFDVSIEYLLGLEDDFGVMTAAPMGESLTTAERELLADFRRLSPYLQGIAKNTVRGLTGAGASDLQKKA